MSTIIVHGTGVSNMGGPFEDWWQGKPPFTQGHFLHKLNEPMDDVWRIGRKDVGEYADIWEPLRKRDVVTINGRFRWSGEFHPDRRSEQAQLLVEYLEALQSISRREPIDIVAHSHGANLVKLATQYVSGDVNLRCLVFLGAPHIEVKSDEELDPVDAYPCRLKKGALDGGVLNVFSEEDTIQTTWAIFGKFLSGFSVKVNRIDRDQDTQSAYENLQIRTKVGGRTAHAVMHGPTVGDLIGRWLVKFPQKSGEEIWHSDFQNRVLTRPEE